jgi:hypothetical protein
MTTILQEAAAGRATIVPWAVEQYHRAVESGFVPEDTSVELIDGFLVHKDRAKAGEDRLTIGDRHRIALLRLAQSARPSSDSVASCRRSSRYRCRPSTSRSRMAR